MNTRIMRIDIITVVPELLESPLGYSIVGRAIRKGLVEIHVHNLRKYGKGPRLQVDDYSYGGDAGMVLMVEPVYRMIEELKSERSYDEVIYMSPDGEHFDQNMANELSLKENIIILCGHYKGVDHRIREHLVTREITVGDYVLSGGELPAAIVADAIVRLLPGAITDETSALSDCYQACRIQRLESPGCAPERESEADTPVAGRAGGGKDPPAQARTSGRVKYAIIVSTPK